MIKINQVHHNQVHQENHENHGSDNVESEAGMSEWKECKLGDIASSNLKSITKDYSYETIYYLDTGSITCGKLESYQKLSLGDSPSRAKRIVSDNDIVYSNVRPIQRHYGIIKNPPENLIASTGFSVISVDKTKADARFVYDFLTSNEIVEYLDSVAEGSTSAYPSLRPADIDNLTILLPPLPEQKAIASVLSSLDDKIDLLHRQNKTLEAMAEALFRQWFMEEGKTICAITDFVDFNPSRQLGKQSIAPYLEMSNVSTSVFHPENWYDREFSAGTKFKNGDTLLARITPCLENGKTTFVTFLAENQIGWGSTEFIVMRSKENIVHPFFTYVLAKNDDFRGYAEGCLEGSSGRQRVNVDHLKNYELYAPEKNQINQFNEFSKSIVPKLDHNFKQIKILEKLRDTLLPKLMSGEVRVNVCTRFTGLRDGHD